MKTLEHFLKEGMRGVWFVPSERDDILSLVKTGIERSKTGDAKAIRELYLEKLKRLLDEHTIDTQNEEKVTMGENVILKAWRGAIKLGEQVRHKADWERGEYVGHGSHPSYDASVIWAYDDEGVPPGPTQLQNLYPAWWPTPDWVKSQNG